ncbi:MAG: hypothetical protein AB8G11_11505 [Saprospiraceae bacterium]
MIAKLLQKASENPKQLFLIDALGAMVTAFLTGVVLTYFEAFFGMPTSVLIPLALIACVFAVYSSICYFKLNFEHDSWQIYLKIIAVVNQLYCGVTFGFVMIYFEQLTTFGIVYFIGEILVVTTLVMVEIAVANSLENTDK